MRESSCTIALTGDAIISRPFLSYHGSTAPFDDLVAALQESTVATTNLEVPIPQPDDPPNGTVDGNHLRARPETLSDLREMGFRLLAGANNHITDYGLPGIEHTLAEIEGSDGAMAGLGRTLHAARAPAAVETPAGRVAMVSASTRVLPGAEASEQTPALPGRPGINPLRMETIYQVTEEQCDALADISRAVGIKAKKRRWRESGVQYGHDWDDERYFHFGDRKVETVPANETGVRYAIEGRDRDAVLQSISDAAVRANYVVAALHFHRCGGGLMNTDETPEAIVTFAHEAIDAGADVFVGTGPHVLQGIELYKGKPIYYSLGNFVAQFESIDRFAPENYQPYGIEDYSRPNALFDSWLRDEAGVPQSQLAAPAWWRTIVPRCTFEGGNLVRVELLPVALGREDHLAQRGIPRLAEGALANEILETVADLSVPFEADIERDGDRGLVRP